MFCMHFPMLILHRRYMDIVVNLFHLRKSKIISQLRYNTIVSRNSCTDIWNMVIKWHCFIKQNTQILYFLLPLQHIYCTVCTFNIDIYLFPIFFSSNSLLYRYNARCRDNSQILINTHLMLADPKSPKYDMEKWNPRKWVVLNKL